VSTQVKRTEEEQGQGAALPEGQGVKGVMYPEDLCHCYCGTCETDTFCGEHGGHNSHDEGCGHTPCPMCELGWESHEKTFKHRYLVWREARR